MENNGRSTKRCAKAVVYQLVSSQNNPGRDVVPAKR